MLSLVFTKKKLLAGVKGDIPQLLVLRDGRHEIALDGLSRGEALKQYLPSILDAYHLHQKEQGKEVQEPVALGLALPVDSDTAAEKDDLQRQLKSESKVELLHVENLAQAFLQGLDQAPDALNYAVLESLDDYAHLSYHRHEQVDELDIKEVGAEALFRDESFEFVTYKDFGESSGREKVLSEILSQFVSAGLKVDVKGQTDLALQLMDPGHDHIFTFSKTTDKVNIEAEVKLSEQEYQALLAANREKVGMRLNPETLKERGIDRVVLLGGFLKSDYLKHYFKETLSLNGELLTLESDQPYDEFATIVSGLSQRMTKVREANEALMAEQARREEEAQKRAQIKAELQVKDDREHLLAEIQSLCVDPDQKEAYEAKFVSRGEALGIPDVVVKWNISEALSKAILKRESEAVGVEGNQEPAADTEKEAEDAKSELPPPAPEPPKPKPEPKPVAKKTVEEKPAAKTPTEKPAEKAKPVVNTPPKAEEPVRAKTTAPSRPEMVKVAEKPQPKAPVSQAAPAPQPKAEKAPQNGAEAAPKAKDAEEKKPTEKKPLPKGNQKVSLNDIFIIKGALPDPEFSTKKVVFHADQELKVVKVLPAKYLNNQDKQARFQKVYEKELSYYQEMSEIGEAREGKYYYRNFLERTNNTLRDYIKRNGLDKKLKIDDLSSTDLKFILQVFKEVRELPVPHANLSEDNILILARRKWNLQRNMEIRFVGFTADDAAQEDMLKQTHAIFSRLMGEGFYKEFREKFQL